MMETRRIERWHLLRGKRSMGLSAFVMRHVPGGQVTALTVVGMELIDKDLSFAVAFRDMTVHLIVASIS
jgi:hypothetical protein